MQISLMCCLGSSGRNYSANLRAHRSQPRWLHLGKVKRFLSVRCAWSDREPTVTADHFTIQYDWPEQEIFKFLMHGWRRGDGGASKRQGFRLLMHANMAVKVRRVAKWLLPIQRLRMRVDIDLTQLLSDSFSLWCYSCTTCNVLGT